MHYLTKFVFCNTKLGKCFCIQNTFSLHSFKFLLHRLFRSNCIVSCLALSIKDFSLLLLKHLCSLVVLLNLLHNQMFFVLVLAHDAFYCFQFLQPLLIKSLFLQQYFMFSLLTQLSDLSIFLLSVLLNLRFTSFLFMLHGLLNFSSVFLLLLLLESFLFGLFAFFFI